MAIISPEFEKLSKELDKISQKYRLLGLSASEADKKISHLKGLASLALGSKNAKKELKELTDIIEDVIPAADELGGSLSDLGTGMTFATARANKWSESLKNSSKEAGIFTSTLKKAGETLIFTAGAMNAPMYALDKLNSVYKDAKKFTLDYQNATFLSGQALKRTSVEFKTAREAVSYYNKTINQIAAASGMTRAESGKLFSAFESGFKGIKDGKVLNTFKQMTVAAKEMGLTLEDAAKYAEKLNQSGNQFAQFKFGNMNGLNDSLALVMNQMGMLNDEALDAQLAIQQAFSKEDRGEDLRAGATKVQTAASYTATSKEGVYLSQANQESFNTMLEYEKSVARTIDGHKQLIGYMENLGEPLKMATEELRKFGNNLAIFNVASGNGFGGKGGGRKFGGGGGNFLGSLFGSLLGGGMGKGGLGGGLLRGGLAMGGRGLMAAGGLGLAGLGIYGGYKGYKALQNYGGGSVLSGIGKGFSGKDNLVSKLAKSLPFGMAYKGEDFSKDDNMANILDPKVKAAAKTGIASEAIATEPIGYLASQERLNELVKTRGKDYAENIAIQKEINLLTGVQVGLSDNLASAHGKSAEIYMSNYSNGKAATEMYKEQIKYIDQSEVKIKAILDRNIEQAKIAHDAANVAKSMGDTLEERKQKEAEISFTLGAQASKMQLISKEAEKYTVSLKKITAEIDAEMKFQEMNITMTKSLADLHTSMRVGIGTSIKDQVNMSRENFKMSALQFENARKLRTELGKIKGNTPEDLAKRKALTLEIQKAEVAGINKQKEGIDDLRSFREGYLDAMEASVVGGGGALEILPTQDSGAQFMAPTPGLGVQFDSVAKARQAAFQGDPIRHTAFGMSGNIGGFNLQGALGAIGDQYSKMSNAALSGNVPMTGPNGEMVSYFKASNEHQSQATEYLQDIAVNGIIIRNSQYKAKGGVINGPSGVDKVPAMLTAGEYVVPKDKAAFAQAFFEGNVRGFTDGGLAQSSSMSDALHKMADNPYLSYESNADYYKGISERRGKKSKTASTTRVANMASQKNRIARQAGVNILNKHEKADYNALALRHVLSQTGDWREQPELGKDFAGGYAGALIASIMTAHQTPNSNRKNNGSYGSLDGFDSGSANIIENMLRLPEGSFSSLFGMIKNNPWTALGTVVGSPFGFGGSLFGGSLGQAADMSTEGYMQKFSDVIDKNNQKSDNYYLKNVKRAHNGGLSDGGLINTLPGELMVPPPAAQNLINHYEKPSSGGGSLSGSIEIVLNVDGKRSFQVVTLDQLKTKGAKVFHSVVGL